MEKLVEKAKLGDSDAYSELINSIKIDLYKIAQTRLNNIEDINDAIHETILNAFKNLKKLKNNQYFKTWIIKILINECNKIYKNNKKQLNIFNRIIDLKDFKSSDNTIEKVENKLFFEDLIKQLPYEERIVIVLYYNNHYTTGEIAKILNKSPNTIKSRLLRAKEKIKKESKGGLDYEKSK